MATVTRKPATSVSMSVTHLATLANATVTAATASVVGYKSGSQTVRVDDTTLKSLDYQIMLKLTTAATNPANDKAIYVYVIPWYKTDAAAWLAGDFGTATLPTGTDGAANIGDQNNLRIAKILPYNTTSAVLYGEFKLSSLFGAALPDGWSLAVVNYSGAALTAAEVHYRSIAYESA